jgi:hypothetical protein
MSELRFLLENATLSSLASINFVTHVLGVLSDQRAKSGQWIRLEPHPQLPKFQPLSLGANLDNGVVVASGQVTFSPSPGAVEEGGALPLPGLHLHPLEKG